MFAEKNSSEKYISHLYNSLPPPSSRKRPRGGTQSKSQGGQTSAHGATNLERYPFSQQARNTMNPFQQWSYSPLPTIASNSVVHEPQLNEVSHSYGQSSPFTRMHHPTHIYRSYNPSDMLNYQEQNSDVRSNENRRFAQWDSNQFNNYPGMPSSDSSVIEIVENESVGAKQETLFSGSPSPIRPKRSLSSERANLSEQEDTYPKIYSIENPCLEPFISFLDTLS